MSKEKRVTVDSFIDVLVPIRAEFNAHLLKTRLEAEGIEVFIEDEFLKGSAASGGYKIKVKESDAERVSKIMELIRKEKPRKKAFKSPLIKTVMGVISGFISLLIVVVSISSGADILITVMASVIVFFGLWFFSYSLIMSFFFDKEGP